MIYAGKIDQHDIRISVIDEHREMPIEREDATCACFISFTEY
jgi:hypothetical protein